jgi:hypothetical protein
MTLPANSTSDDRSQSQAMNSVLPSSSLYQPNNIWSVNATNRPIGSQGLPSPFLSLSRDTRLAMMHS